MFLFILVLSTLSNCQPLKDMEKPPQLDMQGGTYTMPPEEASHEGTWLQWPHNYTYRGHTDRHDATFIAMTKALHTGERVHIVVYNTT